MDTKHLAELARAATPGPWYVEETAIVNLECETDDWEIAEVYGAANRLYIRNLSPDVILEILAANEALTKELNNYKDALWKASGDDEEHVNAYLEATRSNTP